MTDKNTIRLSSAAVLVALLLALFLPIGESGRIVAAVLLIPAAVLIPTFIKKRDILSIHKNQVLLIVAVIALLYVMIYYLTGFSFGFIKNPYKLSFNVFLKYILPILIREYCTIL